MSTTKQKVHFTQAQISEKWDEFLDLYSFYLRAPIEEVREELFLKTDELRQMGSTFFPKI